MAALTQITSAIVRTTLGAVTNVWRLLIIHNNINMWSRKKPTRYNGVTPTNFWKGSDGRCGFDLPILQSGTTYSPTTWGYLKPRGGDVFGEKFRVGDFRGYDHDLTLKPPFYSYNGSGGNILHATLSPVPNSHEN